MNLSEGEQSELRRNEQWLAQYDAPELAGDAVERAKLAARVAADEAWLERFATPAPRPEAVARTKASVQGALAAEQRTRRMRLIGVLGGAGTLAAAALVALLVAIRPTSVTKPQPRPDGGADGAVVAADKDAEVMVDRFVNALDSLETDQDIAALTEAVDAYDWQAAALTSGSEATGLELELEYLQDQIDLLFAEPVGLLETS
jgi:hypothetical protein